MVRLKRLLPILALSILLPLLLPAKEHVRTEEAVVKKVVDGDTVNVATGEGTKLKVRLYGINAPETAKLNRRSGVVLKPGQPYGEEAYRALEIKVFGKRVKVQIVDVDRYRRTVSILYLGDRDINREMATEGYAWAYREYLHGPYASEYIDAEREARSKILASGGNQTPNRRGSFADV